jgi:hypothetical protein
MTFFSGAARSTAAGVTAFSALCIAFCCICASLFSAHTATHFTLSTRRAWRRHLLQLSRDASGNAARALVNCYLLLPHAIITSPAETATQCFAAPCVAVARGVLLGEDDAARKIFCCRREAGTFPVSPTPLSLMPCTSLSTYLPFMGCRSAVILENDSSAMPLRHTAWLPATVACWLGRKQDGRAGVAARQGGCLATRGRNVCFPVTACANNLCAPSRFYPWGVPLRARAGATEMPCKIAQDAGGIHHEEFPLPYFSSASHQFHAA